MLGGEEGGEKMGGFEKHTLRRSHWSQVPELESRLSQTLEKLLKIPISEFTFSQSTRPPTSPFISSSSSPRFITFLPQFLIEK